jgi:hypothetical protein
MNGRVPKPGRSGRAFIGGEREGPPCESAADRDAEPEE